jgi:hypothetical protein
MVVRKKKNLLVVKGKPSKKQCCGSDSDPVGSETFSVIRIWKKHSDPDLGSSGSEMNLE